MAEARVLVLGGTGEALDLVRRIAAEAPPLAPILSLAGRTRAPKRPDGVPVRIGGFGGAAGLAVFLKAEGITALVDATHPFAPQISRNAGEAARAADMPLLRLERPAWTPGPGERWIDAADEAVAAAALPHGAWPFLALGRQHLAPFLARPDLKPLLRMVDPPEAPLPPEARLILGLPSSDPAAEAALMEAHGATHLVCRNSGGGAGFAKVEAAGRLGLPVLMIARPEMPVGGEVLATVDAVLERLRALIRPPSCGGGGAGGHGPRRRGGRG